MRGNEVLVLDAIRRGVWFTIPMRGNEMSPWSAVRRTPSGFTIPMRGNEVFSNGADVHVEAVYDPHEG